MQIPLGECTDEQLIAELTRRKLDLQANITEDFVKKTYDFGAFLGRGASGDVVVGVHKATKKQYAIKVVKRNSSMNDADSMSTEIEILKRVSFRHLVCMRELFETPQCLWIVLDLVTVR
jgi:serine/threonine protein kinase